MQFLEISLDFGILGFSKILGFFQRFFGIFDVVYEDFQSNLPLGCFNVRESLVWFNDYWFRISQNDTNIDNNDCTFLRRPGLKYNFLYNSSVFGPIYEKLFFSKGKLFKQLNVVFIQLHDMWSGQHSAAAIQSII